jgi:hypothetical protein
MEVWESALVRSGWKSPEKSEPAYWRRGGRSHWATILLCLFVEVVIGVVIVDQGGDLVVAGVRVEQVTGAPPRGSRLHVGVIR